LSRYKDNNFHAVVTDPPYGFSQDHDVFEVMKQWMSVGEYETNQKGILGKEWDGFVPSPNTWREIFRVLRPGGHMLAMGGSRTEDLLTIAIRMAGFEIRDKIAWIHGQGFSHAYDVAKGIEAKILTGSANWNEFRKLQGADRETSPLGYAKRDFEHGFRPSDYGKGRVFDLDPQTIEGKEWMGWSTGIVPSIEYIIVARKPLSEGSVVENVLKWGTGAVNIGACAIPSDEEFVVNKTEKWTGFGQKERPKYVSTKSDSRKPKNVIFDEEAIEWLEENKRRFFYASKPNKKEKDSGLEGKNTHATIKPVSLMSYLCKLVTPEDGWILDPFLGSGTTGIAAMLEGFNFVGIEQEQESFEIARIRIDWWRENK